jgi:hypothetical protein
MLNLSLRSHNLGWRTGDADPFWEPVLHRRTLDDYKCFAGSVE